MTTNRRSWVLPLGLLGVFVAGATTGVFAAAGFVHHRLRALHQDGPKAIHALGMQWLDWELDLTPEQKKQVDELLVDTHDKLFRFKSEHNDEIKAIVMPALDRMDQLLTPEQREEWKGTREKIVKHVDATISIFGH